MPNRTQARMHAHRHTHAHTHTHTHTCEVSGIAKICRRPGAKGPKAVI